MVDNFPAFARLVSARFQQLTKDEHSVYVTSVDKDALYAQYLAAFPDGTNPIFKKQTEHDCSTCKQFIRHVGDVVFIGNDLKVLTVWDHAANDAPYPYNVVAKHLRSIVLEAKIQDIFRVNLKEGSFGAEKSRSVNVETGNLDVYNHLFTGPIRHELAVASPGQTQGEYRTTVQVFQRGLVELKMDATETVLSLVEANNLYRGEEHKSALLTFLKAQKEYRALKTGREWDLYAWAHARGPASRFRNTVIGTLVQDISGGRDVEGAVQAFETKVAPTNYKRTTAVITPGMVKKAMETIETLGLESALERRFAVIGDISVNDVKWVDGAVKPLMKGGIGDVLMQHATAATPKNTEADEKRAEEIALDDFVARILPETTSMELFLKSEHLGNLMSLTAPVDPKPQQLFRWNNDFAWSYSGNIADSIKERVKKAGGKVDGAVLRVSLSWFNHDDLDLHIIEPSGRGSSGARGEIYYAAKRGWTGGVLDVDMNAGVGMTREPVENVVWSAAMPTGTYKVVVNNFAKRESSNVGFVVEIESGGKLSHFSYNKAVQNRADVHVASLFMKEGRLERLEVIDPAITAANISQEKWGLTTEQYAKVSAVTLSPNYWGDNAVGNKHTFFVLDGAKNDESTRGFYNEFLHPRLEPHRKVFEVIGDKTKCQPTDGQLSGLGFSSTKKEYFLVKTHQGKRQRLFNVRVGA